MAYFARFRLWVAAALAGAALAGCEGMAEVDKALYAAADAVSERDRVTRQRTLDLTHREEQIRQADAIAEQEIAEHRRTGRPLNEELDPDAYARLERVFRRVHAVSHFASEEWKLVLIPDNEFNAKVYGGT